MRINVTSVLVDDQDKALRFYTDVLGFMKKTEIPLGDRDTAGRSSLADGRLPRGAGGNRAASRAGRLRALAQERTNGGGEGSPERIRLQVASGGLKVRSA